MGTCLPTSQKIGPYVLMVVILPINKGTFKMAFPSAIGHNNLPNGNFSPVIYSKKVQLAFRRASVVQAITNTE